MEKDVNSNLSKLLSKKVTRRKALATGAKIGIAAGVAAIVAGVGGYFGGLASAPAKEVTKTVPGPERTVTVEKTVAAAERTITQTVTQTITQTITAPAAPPAKIRFDGVKITVAALAGGATGPISGPFYHYKGQFKAETGADIEVVEISFADLPIKLIADFTTKTGAYDLFVPCSNMMGDWVIPGYVHELDKWMADPRFPKWDPDDVPYAVAEASRYGGKWYGVPWDSDAWYFNWHMDFMNKVLRDKSKRDEFKSKYGYELDPYGLVKNRKLTWEKVRDMAEFFTGWDWNGDGEDDWGMVMGLRVGEQGPMWVVPFVAPWVIQYGPTNDRYHNIFWFDPETMEPLVKTEGWKEGVRMFNEIVKFTPPAAKTFTFADKWDYFLNKRKAMFLFTAPDTFTLVGNPEKSKGRGFLMTTPAPGSERVWDLKEKTWINRVNLVGNAAGCSWHPWVSSFSKNPEASYYLAAWLATPEKHRETTASAYFWTGVDPGFFSDILTDYGGKATLKDYNLPGNFQDPGYPKALYEEGDLRRAHIAVFNNYFAMDAQQQFYVKVTGAIAMFTSIDTHIVGEMLVGGISPAEALSRVYSDWNKIIDEVGREKEKGYYHAMIEYNKPNRYKPQKWLWDDRVVPKDVVFS